jgi:MFS family permease
LSTTAGADSSARHSAFAEPLFRRYFPSSCLSTLGSWTLRFLLGWSAWELTGSALWVGIVAGLMLAPTFLLSPLFGVLADHINPRNGIVATLTMHGVVAAAAAVASVTGVFSVPWLLFLAACLGAATSAHTPIRLALIPRLVGRGALPSAIGFSAMTFNSSRILGPALGAWLIAAFSTGTAYLVSTLLFAGAIPVLLSVRGVTPPPPREPASIASQLRAGLRYARDHRGIRLIFGFTLVNGLLGRTVIEILPALSGKLLAGDAGTLATLTASAGGGSIIGGLVVSRQTGQESRLLGLVAASLTAGALLLLAMRWLPGLAAFSIAIMLLSMITTMAGTGSQALAQLTVAEDFRGRVLSLWTVLAMGAPSLGALAMGALADRVGFPPVLAGFAAVALLALGLLWARRGALLDP